MPKTHEDRENEATDSGRPSEQAIAKRAYELYLQRGSVPGYELTDWLEAEAQLMAEANDARNVHRQQATPVASAAPDGARGGRRREASASGNGRRAARP